MIYRLIRDFINLRIAVLNEAKTELVDLRENVQWLDVNNLPANASDVYYNFKLPEMGNDDQIEANLRVPCRVDLEFTFPLFNGGVEKYQHAIDEYTYNLLRLFNFDELPGSKLPYRNESISQGLILTDVHAIRFRDLNNINNGYLNPVLEIEIIAWDESELLFPVVQTENSNNN